MTTTGQNAISGALQRLEFSIAASWDDWDDWSDVDEHSDSAAD